MKEKTIKTILFAGDSISCGVGAKSPENRFSTQTVKLLNENSDGILYVEKNIAVSGSTLCDSKWPEDNVSAYPDKLQALIDAKPDIAVIQHGVNDQTTHSSIGDFGWSYRQFIREAKAALPDTTFVVLTITPTNRRGELALFHDITNTIIQEIAAREGLLLAQINLALDQKIDLFPDGVHPNPAGHRIMAETVAATIRENRPQSPEKFDFIMRRAGHHRIMSYVISISEATAQAGISCFYGISRDGFTYSSYGPVTFESPFRHYLEPAKFQGEDDFPVPQGKWDDYLCNLTVKLPSTGGRKVRVKIIPV